MFAALALVFAACAVEGEPTTTLPTPGPTTTIPTSTTTAAIVTTTTTSPIVTEPATELSALPIDTSCALDEVPTGGEATVLVGDRLYGLGGDSLHPRCVVDGVLGTDFEWGPMGDRIRVGTELISGSAQLSIAAVTSYVWTGPTGTKLVSIDPDVVSKTDITTGSVEDITFLDTTDAVAYHPAGTHLLAIGTDFEGQYGLWLATNTGTDPLLIAFDEGAVLAAPAWSWLGEPLFTARHFDGTWHIHRIELTEEGALEGPIVVESDQSIDMLMPARYDPVMLAYRLGGVPGEVCVDDARVNVNNAELPEPIESLTSTPVGWLSAERLLLMTYPDGCGAPGDLWSFSAGLCPGSTYGAELIIEGIDWAAARETAPQPPPPPDFTGLVDPAPA